MSLFQNYGNSRNVCLSNSKLTVPKPKRDLKNILAFLPAGKKRGPSPFFFPPPPHPPSLGLFSAPYAMEMQQKGKNKVKKWSNAHTEGGTGVNRI
jgi:hypothetical protein